MTLIGTIRERLGLTIRELAHLLGVSHSTISKMEKGTLKINPALLLTLAELEAYSQHAQPCGPEPEELEQCRSYLLRELDTCQHHIRKLERTLTSQQTAWHRMAIALPAPQAHHSSAIHKLCRVMQDKLDDRRLSKHLLLRTQTQLELANYQTRQAAIEQLLAQMPAAEQPV